MICGSGLSWAILFHAASTGVTQWYQEMRQGWRARESVPPLGWDVSRHCQMSSGGRISQIENQKLGINSSGLQVPILPSREGIFPWLQLGFSSK